MGGFVITSHDPKKYSGFASLVGQSRLDTTDEQSLVQLARMFEESDALIGAFDENDILRISNRAWRSALCIGDNEQPSWAEMMRRNYILGRGTRIVTDNFDKWLSSAVSRRAKLKSRTFETDLLDGRWLLMQETAHPNGWLLCVACDVSVLRMSERRLRVDRDGALIAAQTDELTGISNRRHIMGLLEAMQNGTDARGYANGYACLIDIDYFKKVNDTHGHLVGDDVLISVAQSIRRSIRTSDSLGRVGGEEFLLLVATNIEADAREILNRVLFDISQLRPVLNAPDVQITISGGIAPISHQFPANTIYAKCDAQLYRAKDEGRNRLCIADETMLGPV